MGLRYDDGSAGDANYGAIGAGYTAYRQPDPRIAAFIDRALGDAHTILNVGAGAGSYEPRNRSVTPVEPSASMRALRPVGLPPAIDAVAEQLPFADNAFDASMATFSVHQWRDLHVGLTEMRRVTCGPVVILTCDPAALHCSWLSAYAPDMIAVEARRYPNMDTLIAGLGAQAQVTCVPIPFDCTDGFSEAYYGRPERLLESGARRANSAWSFVTPEAEAAFVTNLGRDLGDGTWDKRYSYLRKQSEFNGSLRIIVG